MGARGHGRAHARRVSIPDDSLPRAPRRRRRRSDRDPLAGLPAAAPRAARCRATGPRSSSAAAARSATTSGYESAATSTSRTSGSTSERSCTRRAGRADRPAVPESRCRAGLRAVRGLHPREVLPSLLLRRRRGRGGALRGFQHHVDDWVPQRLVTATAPLPSVESCWAARPRRMSCSDLRAERKPTSERRPTSESNQRRRTSSTSRTCATVGDAQGQPGQRPRQVIGFIGVFQEVRCASIEQLLTDGRRSGRGTLTAPKGRTDRTTVLLWASRTAATR